MRALPWSWIVLALLATPLRELPPQGDPSGTTALPARRLCFRGRPLPECGSFWLTEFSHQMRLGSDPSFGGTAGNVYWTWEVGWMKNRRGGRTTIGGNLLFGAEEDIGIRLGVKARYRRWLSASTSLDVGAGPLLGQDGAGLTTHLMVDFGNWAALGFAFDVHGGRYGGTTAPVYPRVRFGSYPGAILGVLAPGAALIAVLTLCCRD